MVSASPRVRATIKQVATEAGVSIATVSLVMRGLGNFPDKTRTHVQATAKRLGYHANKRAAGLRSGNNRTIGFVLTAASNHEWTTQWSGMLAQVLFGLVVTASTRGYSIVIVPANSPEAMASFGLDALILNDTSDNDPDIETAHKLGLIIGTYDRLDDPRVSVHLDPGYSRMTTGALDYLSSRGSARPGLLTEEENLVSNSRQVESYLNWCAQRAISPVVVRGRHDRLDVRDRVDDLIEAGCDAIYSFYGEGPTILERIQERGLSCPGDIQLIAASPYNDDENRSLGISSTVYHPELMIEGPVNMLMDAIEGSISLPTTFSAPWELTTHATTR